MNRRTLIAAPLAALACALGSSAIAQPVTLRYATFLPPNGIFTSPDGVMGRWGKAIERDSNGAVKLEIMPGGTMGAAGRDPSAQLKLVTDGIADISFVIPSTTPGRFPDDNVFGFPVAENSLEASLTFWRLREKGLMRGYDDKAFYVIGLIVNPPNTLHSKPPIAKLEDMKGKRMQSSGTEQQELLRALGATPVGTVTVRDAAEAISRGVIDGTPKDWIALHSFRIAEAATNHVNIPLGASTILFAMNRARFDGLPPAAKAAIEKHSGAPFVRMAGEMFDASYQQAYLRTKNDPKHTIVELPKDERARWDQASAGVVAAWRQKDPVNETLWNAFVQTRDEVRRELAKR